MRKFLLVLALIFAACSLLALAYRWPPLHDRLVYQLDRLQASVKYAISPPEQAIFVPKESTPLTPTATFTPFPLPTETPTPPGATATPVSSPTPTITPTPLPPQAMLEGFRHEFQTWNNCGPANLSMGLSYWGWQGNQRDTAAFLKPNERDKNVMPYEMEAFVDEETDLDALVRVGGDLDTLKAFISAGFPVLVEKGFEGVGFDGWMGHYEVINGYDDAKGVVYAQDSYKGPNLEVSYKDLIEQWRAFNYTYLVIYSPEKEAQVMELLGLQANDRFNYHTAEQKARQEVQTLTGRDLFFALYNQGSSLVHLQDYTAAATAYDAAFANYASIPEAERPWRMLWYQTGPYFAYYFTQRYQDLIDLATTTLDAMSEPILEESYYWRGRAKLALGDREGAIEDFQQSLEVHPDFTPSLEQLGQLGVKP